MITLAFSDYRTVGNSEDNDVTVSKYGKGTPAIEPPMLRLSERRKRKREVGWRLLVTCQEKILYIFLS